MSLRLSTTFFIFFRLQPRELCSLRQLVHITKLTPPCQPLFCFFSFFFSSSPFSSFILPLLTSYTPCLPLPADLYINISQSCRYFWNSDQCRFSAYPDPAPDFAVRNADIQIMIVRRSVIAQAQSTFQQVKHFIHVTPSNIRENRLYKPYMPSCALKFIQCGMIILLIRMPSYLYRLI